jgi:DNA-binding response OmpR family regulator
MDINGCGRIPGAATSGLNKVYLTMECSIAMCGSLTTRTILIVDDELALLKLLKALLDGAGFHVLIAASALDAIEMCRRTKVDLLLVELGMPDLRGPELARSVTRIARDARVLFMSGSDGKSLSSTEFSWLECGILQKPFSPADLLNAVDAALDLFSAGTDSHPNAPSVTCHYRSAKGATL